MYGISATEQYGDWRKHNNSYIYLQTRIYNITLTVYDNLGNTAIGHSTARVVERTNYAPKEAATDQGLTVQSIYCMENNGDDILSRNDDLAYHGACHK